MPSVLRVHPDDLQIVSFKTNMIFAIKDQGKMEQYYCLDYQHVRKVQKILKKKLMKAKKMAKTQKVTLEFNPFAWNAKNCLEINETVTDDVLKVISN